VLYRPSSPPSTPLSTVSGQYLAKNRLSKRGRAQLATDILAGKVMATDFTIKQLVVLCRVSRPYIVEARNRTRRPDYATRLARAWRIADSDERIQFIRRADPERVFDALTAAIA
jgi:hypothetical protein